MEIKFKVNLYFHGYQYIFAFIAFNMDVISVDLFCDCVPGKIFFFSSSRDVLFEWTYPNPSHKYHDHPEVLWFTLSLTDFL